MATVLVLLQTNFVLFFFQISLGNNSEVLFILQHIFNSCHFPFHKNMCSLLQKTQKITQKREILKDDARYFHKDLSSRLYA